MDGGTGPGSGAACCGILEPLGDSLVMSSSTMLGGRDDSTLR